MKQKLIFLSKLFKHVSLVYYSSGLANTDYSKCRGRKLWFLILLRKNKVSNISNSDSSNLYIGRNFIPYWTRIVFVLPYFRRSIWTLAGIHPIQCSHIRVHCRWHCYHTWLIEYHSAHLHTPTLLHGSVGLIGRHLCPSAMNPFSQRTISPSPDGEHEMYLQNSVGIN